MNKLGYSLLLLGLTPLFSVATLILDEDFESYTVGEVLGSSRVVVAEPAGFSGNAGVFEVGSGGYLYFIQPTILSEGIHQISFDLAISDAQSHCRGCQTIGSFGVAYSSFIELYDYREYIYGTPNRYMSIGGTRFSYPTDTSIHFQFLYDSGQGQFQITADGDEVYSQEVEGFALSSLTFQNNGRASFTLDNIQWKIVPEPSTSILMLIAGLGCWMRRSRKRC